MARGSRRNRTGGTYHLTVVTAVRPGEEDHLRRRLEMLPEGASSPLSGPGTVHFGRWVLMGGVGGRSRRRGVPCGPGGWFLLFTVVVDGEPGGFLDRLVATAGPTVEAIWGHCVGFPGGAGPARVVTWLEDHAIDNTLCFATWAGPTVDDIRTALARREEVIAMALETQGLPAPALQQAFNLRFG